MLSYIIKYYAVVYVCAQQQRQVIYVFVFIRKMHFLTVHRYKEHMD